MKKNSASRGRRSQPRILQYFKRTFSVVDLRKEGNDEEITAFTKNRKRKTPEDPESTTSSTQSSNDSDSSDSVKVCYDSNLSKSSNMSKIKNVVTPTVSVDESSTSSNSGKTSTANPHINYLMLHRDNSKENVSSIPKRAKSVFHEAQTVRKVLQAANPRNSLLKVVVYEEEPTNSCKEEKKQLQHAKPASSILHGTQSKGNIEPKKCYTSSTSQKSLEFIDPHNLLNKDKEYKIDTKVANCPSLDMNCSNCSSSESVELIEETNNLLDRHKEDKTDTKVSRDLLTSDDSDDVSDQDSVQLIKCVVSPSSKHKETKTNKATNDLLYSSDSGNFSSQKTMSSMEEPHSLLNKYEKISIEVINRKACDVKRLVRTSKDHSKSKIKEDNDFSNDEFMSNWMNTSRNRKKQTETNSCDAKVKINASQHNISDNFSVQERASSSKTDLPYALDFDCDQFFEEEWSLDDQMNFKSLQRCKVVDIEIELNQTLLTVTDCDNKTANTTIKCMDFWKDIKVKKNDIIAAEGFKEADHWVVNNNRGFIVVHPDVLISGTTIVGGLFCARKAVLGEKFKKIESLPYFKGDQSPMIIGLSAHQLLQKALRQNVSELSDVSKLLNEILESKDTLNMLYGARMTFETFKEQMQPFVSKVYQFVQHYVKNNRQKDISNIRGNFEGQIVGIPDIEENLWLPNLGVKGRIDATVEVRTNSYRKIMPLEVKSGKVTNSVEHKGQLLLYIMMMTLTGQDTDAGLLLYLRDNSMQEVKNNHREGRDLILLRNSLVHYLAPKSVEELCSKPQRPTFNLPEPINNYNACVKCSYNTLCCASLNNEDRQLPNAHPLVQLSKSFMSQFKPSHMEYISKWISILQLEEMAQTSDMPLSYLWTLSPEKRESKKICVSNLKISGTVKECNNKFRHTFVRKGTNTNNIPHNMFSNNEYVLVSTDKRVNLAAGFIAGVNNDWISVYLDRDISKYGITDSFHIDKYSSSSLTALNLANVGGLMGIDDTCRRLREIIVERKPATYQAGLSNSTFQQGTDIMENLNEDQQLALLKAMTADHYMLIKGMPGTGKSETITSLVQWLINMNQSVLITAHTHSAVDNILLKLHAKDIDFLRLGAQTSIHRTLRKKGEKCATVKCRTLEEMEKVYSSKNIVGVTCYGSNHPLLTVKTFDVCIVDECTQALQPTVLRPLYSARRFILVGDPDQLPPIIKSRHARRLGGDESLFVRLDDPRNTVELTRQYRMNNNIMNLANKMIYNDKLVAGSSTVANSVYSLNVAKVLSKEPKWIQKALSNNISDSVILIDTKCVRGRALSIEMKNKYVETAQSNANIWEASVVHKIIQVLDKMKIDPSSIGIISPYNAHVNLLRKIIRQGIEINTVDQYQGRDKTIIIYTCTKSMEHSDSVQLQDSDILSDKRRLTVAITRAKCKLIIIADKTTMSKYSIFRELFDLIEKKNIVDLTNDCDFKWKNMISML